MNLLQFQTLKRIESSFPLFMISLFRKIEACYQKINLVYII